MKKRPGGILAVYKYLDHVTDAMEGIHDRNDFKDHEVFSPTSYHEIEEAGRFGNSAVRWFALIGGLLGTLSGFLLCMFMDTDWPLVVGGKTPGIHSLPVFAIFCFELTILFGGVATIFGMLIMGKLPNPTQRILDTRFTDDRFGIFVPNAKIDGPQAQFLKSCGADELKVVGEGN